MKIAIAADHAGFKLKESLKLFLHSKNHNIIDLGPTNDAPCDYPVYGKLVGKAVASGDADMGVLVCGSGIGMCMTANRFKGVRAAVLNDKADAESSRKHNDANVACFGARKISEGKAKELLDIWLATKFEGGRHERRVKKLDTGL